MGYSPNNLLTSTQGGDAGQGLHSDGDWPTPISTGGLTTVPEAAVTHEHPTVECELKKPCPSLLRSELLTNQVTDSPMLWNELIPFELNSPWAYKRNELLDIRGISSVVACVQAAPFDGACSQIRNWIRVIGVAVGDGSAVLELPPQLSNSVVITKASTGATTKHLFCHIKHPAMPWQLQRCQAVPKKTKRTENSIRVIAWSAGGRFEIELESRPHKGTAGIERGGRLPDARLFTARLAADINSAAGRS